MKPTVEDIREEREPWEMVTEETLGTSKWGTHQRTIVRHRESGKFYAVDFEQTPQDGRNYLDDEPYEVAAIEERTVCYVVVPKVPREAT